MRVSIKSNKTGQTSNRFFCDLSLGFNLPVKIFFFNNTYVFSGYLAGNFASFFDLLIYYLLAIMTCFVYSIQTRKRLVVFWLYFIMTPSKLFDN